MGGRLLNAEQSRKSYPTKMNGDDTWQKMTEKGPLQIWEKPRKNGRKFPSPAHIAARSM